MQSYYYTKNPIDMIFTNKDDADRFYARVNNVSLDRLLEENELHGVSATNRDLVNKLITKQNEDFVNREGDFTASGFNFYPLSAYVGKEELMTDIAYDPTSLANVFASAYDDYSYNRYHDDNPTLEERLKIIDALAQAVEKGINVEILKLHLAKILNEQTETIKKNGKKSIYFEEIMRTENLLSHAEELSKEFSPYEKVFKMGEEIASLKSKSKKLEGEEWEKAREKLADMKSAFDKECAKFDPEMLQDVTNHRKQYYVEVDKNMAMSKNTNFDLAKTINTPAYQSTNLVGLYAKSAMQREERNRN